MRRLLFTTMLLLACAGMLLVAGDAKIGGNWQIAMDTPHGPMSGSLVLKQDGANLTGSLETEMFGKLDLTGKVDGSRMSFVVEIHGDPITFTGSIDGNKMTGGTAPVSASWTATRQ